jgi:Type IV leader peptidase family
VIPLRQTARESFGITLVMTTARAFLFLVSGFVGWSILFPSSSPLPFAYAAATMTALLIAVSICDWLSGRIRNEITYPLMCVGILRAILLRDPSFLVLWAALLLLFTTHILAGGDIKLMMALSGLWPTLELVGVWVVVTIITHTPVVFYKHVLKPARRIEWTALRGSLEMIWLRIWARDLPSAGQCARLAARHLPSEEDLAEQGERFAFSIALVGIVYLYVFTPAGLGWNGVFSF